MRAIPAVAITVAVVALAAAPAQAIPSARATGPARHSLHHKPHHSGMVSAAHQSGQVRLAAHQITVRNNSQSPHSPPVFQSPRH